MVRFTTSQQRKADIATCAKRRKRHEAKRDRRHPQRRPSRHRIIQGNRAAVTSPALSPS